MLNLCVHTAETLSKVAFLQNEIVIPTLEIANINNFIVRKETLTDFGAGFKYACMYV